MQTLTRLHLVSLLGLLIAVAVAVLAGYLLLLDNGKTYYQQRAEHLARSVSVFLGQQQHRLQLLAGNPQIQTLANSNAETPTSAEITKTVSANLDGAVSVTIIRADGVTNLLVPHSSINPADLKRYWKRGNASTPKFQYSGKRRAYYDLVVPIKTTGSTNAVLLASYPIKNLRNALPAEIPENCKIDIVTRIPDDGIIPIIQFGKTTNKTSLTILSMPIADTEWQLRLSLPYTFTPLTPVGWLHISVFVLAMIAIIVVSVLVHTKTVRSIDHDLRSLARLFKDVRSGKVRVDYPLNLQEFSELFNYLRSAGKKLTMEQQAARDLGLIDHLTQVSNRRHFESRLQDLFGKVDGLKPSAVLLIDLDHFKQVNDQYGHDAGDVLLVEFARVLKQNIRSTDFVARLGGDEFCVIFTYTTLEKAAKLAALLRNRLPKEIFLPRNRTHALKWTGGLSIMDKTDGRYDSVLQRADQALYQAKARGRNNTVVYQQTDLPPNVKQLHKPG